MSEGKVIKLLLMADDIGAESTEKLKGLYLDSLRRMHGLLEKQRALVMQSLEAQEEGLPTNDLDSAAYEIDAEVTAMWNDTHLQMELVLNSESRVI